MVFSLNHPISLSTQIITINPALKYDKNLQVSWIHHNQFLVVKLDGKCWYWSRFITNHLIQHANFILPEYTKIDQNKLVNFRSVVARTMFIQLSLNPISTCFTFQTLRTWGVLPGVTLCNALACVELDCLAPLSTSVI